MITLSCPSCGAAVNFQSKASVFAVCSFCKSTMVRHDKDLSLLGKMSELQDERSPLQIGSKGFYEGKAFELIGRLKVEYEDGFWNEWYCLTADGREAWLAEAQGFYAVCFSLQDAFVPELAQISAGSVLFLNDAEFVVDDIREVTCSYSEGELPLQAAAGRKSTSVDLRGPDAQMATLEYASEGVRVFWGKYQDFDKFKFSNLRESLEKQAAFGTAASARSPELKRAQSGAKTFDCKNCGAAVTLRCPGESLTVICQSCFAPIDAGDENYEVFKSYQTVTKKQKPKFELGAKAEFFGHSYEVIGFMVRQDLASGFKWEEYLLYNQQQGYRWLTCSNGHFSFVKSIKDRPDIKYGSHETAVYQGRTYKLFERGKARVAFVLGEFYWRVCVDNRVSMDDYVCPPYMLSVEKESRELNWSLGEYIEPKQVKEAFKNSKLKLGSPKGIGANQPSKARACFQGMLPFWIAFVGILTAFQIWHCGQCLNRLVNLEEVVFTPNTKSTETRTSKVFELTKDHANLELRFSTPVDNSWLYVSGEMVNDQTGVSYDFERSIEYYHGVDGGESWSEGSPLDTLVLSNIPAGKYYINYDYESGSFSNASYGTIYQFTFSVFRDVPTWGNYFWSLFFVSIMPCWYWFMSFQDEVKRWSNSDFSPYVSDSEDD